MKLKNYKITVAVIFSALCFIVCSSVQAQVYEQGHSYLSAGIGLGNRYSLDFPGGFGVSTSAGLPILATFEYGLSEKIGIGALAGITSTSYSGQGQSATNSLIAFGGRGYYHFDANNDKLDFYAGAGLTYYNWSIDSKFSGGTLVFSGLNGVAFDVFAGGRYLFTEKIGAFAELGYSIAYLSLGVTAKF